MTSSNLLTASYFPDPTLSNIDSSLNQFWHPVAVASELQDGRPTQVWLLGVPWVIVNLGGELTAMLDRCPHRLVPLSEGTVVGERLQCKYHGFEFDRAGQCRHIPALGPEGVVPSRIRVLTAEVRVRFGLVWISVAPSPADNDFDESPFTGNGSGRIHRRTVHDEGRCRPDRRQLPRRHTPAVPAYEDPSEHSAPPLQTCGRAARVGRSCRPRSP